MFFWWVVVGVGGVAACTRMQNQPIEGSKGCAGAGDIHAVMNSFDRRIIL